ncbi:MAG: class I SAM-dependent methyltransferase, partial [Gammaproteobacteria bacterium]|nr:class I SAM-dependent methyltransferase [Gammaproteobacteria bacterium]
MDQNEKYCIREDYRPNQANLTLEHEDVVFWSPSRIQSSRLYQLPLYELAKSLVIEQGMQNVIDVGCGPGIKLMSLIAPVANVFGIDQKSAVDYCRTAYNSGTFLVDNFEDPAIELSEEFDLVICSDVIEHLEDPDQLLSYIKRYCNPSTLILISTPDRDKVRGKDCNFCPQKEHIREWNSEEYSNYLKKSGFEIIDHYFLPPLRPG